jgi:acyl transferase domain-containing protein/SAM-dependent methyltransferase/acyl carrier protein
VSGRGPEPAGGAALPTERQALVALRRLRGRLQALEQARTEPIAIVGMACRFPGAGDPAAFWRLLRDGVDAIREVPSERWDLAAWYDPDPDAPGKTYTRHGGFLDGIDRFDAEFFGISPREAASMDPQQRLLLEVAWEALEDAAIAPAALAGSRTGVFAGVSFNDYAQLREQAADPARLDAYAGTGKVASIVANRLSYCLDLRGPSVALDTGCSSSLVAVHLACQSLRAGESSLAVAAGVNVILAPENTVIFAKARMLAPDGRCKTFDAAADGYVRSEGCGVVVLERLADARAAGHRVLAVVRGSAVRQDGRTSGLTVPSETAQAEVIRDALASAGVEPAAVDFVETHGTGTALGDPIEVQALAAALGPGRTADRPLVLGAVKTNLGHLEPAAGMAGLLKVVLALQHGEIPPNLHFRCPNPHLDLRALPAVVPRRRLPWPAGEGADRRLAGVSSFGFGGALAHLLVAGAPAAPATDEAAPPVPARQEAAPPAERPLHVLPLSARSVPALRQLAAAYRDRLAEAPDLPLGDVCATAGAGRSHFGHRLAAVARTAAELRGQLDAFAAGELPAGMACGSAAAPAAEAPRIAFLFGGQGPQRAGMGRGLLATQPVFRAAAERCGEILAPWLPRPLLSLLTEGPDELLAETAVAQPVLVALQLALCELWRAWGIAPDLVFGHSVGEIAAACAAGALSEEAALRLAVERGRAMQDATPPGAMAAVLAGGDEVAAALAAWSGEAGIAAFNGPRHTVVSGSPAAVAALGAAFAARGIEVRPLRATRAFHSPLLDPMLDAFERRAAAVAPGTVPARGWVAGVDGRLVEAAPDAAWWRRQARRPVDFAAAFSALAAGAEVFVELGPAPVLLGLAARLAPDRGLAWLPSLRPDQDDLAVVLGSLAELYVRGAEVDWAGFDRPWRRRRLALPTYPFERHRFWFATGPAPAALPRPAAAAGPFYEVVWRRQEAPAPVSHAAPATPEAPAVPATPVAPASSPGGQWLIVGGGRRLAPALARHLRSLGAVCDLLDGAESGRLAEVLAAQAAPAVPAAPGSGEARRGIVYLAAEDPGAGNLEPTDPGAAALGAAALGAADLGAADLGAGEPGAAGPRSPAAAALRHCQAALALVQAVAGRGGMRLWLVTRGAQAAGGDGDAGAVAEAPLWGLGRTVALEWPELWGGLLDLDPAAGAEESAARLAAELLAGEPGTEAAWRGGRRLVPRLAPAAPPAPPTARTATPIAAEGTYLVTGGLGGIGLRLAGWLLDQGARQLALLGRRSPSPAAEEALARLRRGGARVAVLSADVARGEELAAALARLRQEMPPLRGIFHLAGVLDDAVLPRQDGERLARAFAPKVFGAWALHALTREDQLDCFVLFSSLASVLGSRGQANYGAANAFLDGLARHRRAHGLAATSVCWGPWAETGMAAGRGQRDAGRWAAEGLAPLAPDRALDLLGALLRQGGGQAAAIAVLPDDPTGLARRGAAPPLLYELLSAGDSPEPAVAPAAAPAPEPFRRRLAGALPGDRPWLLAGLVRGEINRVLGHAEDHPLPPRQGLFDGGMDSLMAVELRHRLQARLEPGTVLPPTVVFDHPTPEDLTALLSRLLDVEPAPAAVAAAGATPSPSPASLPAARQGAEPIAVIGLGCRLPGADGPAAFWRLLEQGEDAVGELPAGRWDRERFHDGDAEAPGKIRASRGGFLSRVDLFDPDFFGIAPREAAAMDPQQRLLLEVAWEALEDAGLPPRQLAGSRTGVFVGIGSADYAQLQARELPPADIDAWWGTGAAPSAAAGRLSYLLGVHGPSLAVDTACSSSLVAVHLACQHLRGGECDLALAAGVHLMLSPDTGVFLSRAGALSPDGRSKAFSAAADGYGRGEGCGVVVLKRLSDARRDGDPVLAVVRGSAVNQDGRSAGLTAPNGAAQEAVLRQALAAAGVAPEAVAYVEAHGTGTPLGDPIEIGALAAVLGGGRSPRRPLLVGSVKTNIGHLEAAAGIAGVLKVVLALRHGRIPPHLHLGEPSPHVRWGEVPIAVPTALVPWPEAARPRLAGVSAFGFVGTNAHVVLEEAPPLTEAALGGEPPDRPLHLLALSARGEGALAVLADRYATLLGHDGPELAEVCQAAGQGRDHFEHRLAVVAATRQEVAERLAAGGGIRGRVASGCRPRIAFLYTGQGAPLAGAGRRLYEREPTFRRTFDRCAAILEPILGLPLAATLFAAEPPAADTAFAQPALVALEVALTELWRCWGIEPAAVAGHSVGEIAAAWASGAVELEDALELAARRGRLMQDLTPPGAMAAAFCSRELAAAVLAGRQAELAISAVQGPAHVVLSGSPAALAAATAELAARGVESRPLAAARAFHSPLLEPALPGLAAAAAALRFAPPRRTWVSTLDGLPVTAAIDAAYWSRQARQPVELAAGLTTLWAEGYRTFVEIGPAPVLAAIGRRWARQQAEPGTWLASLQPPRDDAGPLLEALARLYVEGAEVDWSGLHAGRRRRRVELPGYPFERRSYWLGVEGPAAAPGAVGPAAPGAPGGDHIVAELYDSLAVAYRRPGAATAHGDEGLLTFALLPRPVPGFAYLPAYFHPDRHPEHARLLRQGQLALRDLLFRPLDLSAVGSVLDLGCGYAADLVRLAREHPGLRGHGYTISAAQAELDNQEIRRLGLADRLTVFYRDSARDEFPASYDLVFGLEVAGLIEDKDALFGNVGRHLAAGGWLLLADFVASLPEMANRETSSFTSTPEQWSRCLAAGGLVVEECVDVSAEVANSLDDDDFERHLAEAGEELGLSAPALRHIGSYANIGRALRQGLVRYVLIRARKERSVRRDEIERANQPRLSRPTPYRDLALPPALPGGAGGGAEAWRDWLYEVVWRPAPLPPAASPAPPPAAEIAARLAPRLPELDRRLGLERVAELGDWLEALAHAYVVQAFARLGWAPRPGERIAGGELAAELGVQPRHRRLCGRLLAILAEEGALARAPEQGDGAWRVVAVPAAPSPAPLLGELRRRHPEGEAELALLGRCGESLAEVMRGQRDPLALLYPEGSLADTARLYHASLPARALNELAAEAVSLALAALPAGRAPRIVEVGGGTAGTTAALLPRLPAATAEYLFTDLSARFLAEAEERFGQLPFFRCRRLDVAADPAAQGLAPQGYDVVVAANVLHATADLRCSLANVGRLLAPGGLLVLWENCSRQRWVDLVFGLTEGWWSFADAELRPDHPLLSRQGWLRLLAAQGLRAAALPAAAAEGDQAAARLAGQSLILARPAAVAERPWLVLADDGGVAEALAARLAAAGVGCRLVGTAAGAGRGSPTESPDDVAREVARELARQVAAGGGAGPVVHLRNLDAAAEPATAEALQRDQERGCASLLHLVQALLASDGAPRQLWVVTRGAQGIGGEPELLPAQALAWGLGRVLALEHPDLRSVRVDLDPGARPADPESEAATIHAEVTAALAGAPREDEVAWRGGARLAARVARSRLAARPARRFGVRADALYLVTGGLGGLGLEVADWLAARGARHLALVGRRPPGEQAARRLAALREGGVQVEVALADVARPAEVEHLLAALAPLPPLAGIFHCAGVLADGILLQQDWERFRRVLAPKVDGAWALARAAGGPALDAFVLFSSGAALLGAPGQGNHAAANAYLDALAHALRLRGLPATSLGWGAWSEVGAAARRGVEEHIGQRGLGSMPPAAAIAALDHALAEGPAYVGIVPVDWRALLAPFAAGAEPTLFRELAPAGEPPARGAPALPVRAGRPALTGLRQRLAAAPGAERGELLREHLDRQAAAVLGAGGGRRLDRGTPLQELGLDSLMAIELRNALAREVGEVLPATLLFDHPTLDALARYLGPRLPGAVERPVPAPAVARAARRDGGEQAPCKPIAVLGIGCRFPGADDPEELWQLLRQGRDAISEVPPERWDADAWYEPGAPGKCGSRWGGFLRQVDGFDAAFFGVAPREAASMDPQQRLLLETSWEALERAGQAPDRLGGSATGVFVGFSSSDYAQLGLWSGDAGRIDTYSASGGTASVASGRLSYFYGLQGPSLSVDTACSSSLVAVHLACQSLRAGECRMALAGGVYLLLSPLSTVALSSLRMMAADGRCKAFDARADGFVQGEGCGVLVLKRLSDALTAGDPILAVLRGSAVNQDGRSGGLTAPNGPAQEAVLRAALAAAGVAPGAVGFVEAHGTGTALGDPIEAGALAAVFGPGRAAATPLRIGSIKANLGHLAAAAGIAGLVKVILALGHREIPPQAHLETLNPRVPWAELPLAVPRLAAPWSEAAGRRLAGVSSFGFSGTNAHLVVEEAPGAPSPPAAPPVPAPPVRRHQLLPLAARGEGELRELAAAWAARLAATPELPLAGAAFTAGAGRAHFSHRLAVVADSTAAAAAALAAAAAGSGAAGAPAAGAAGSARAADTPAAGPAGAVEPGTAAPDSAVMVGQAAGRGPRIAFLFAGEGASLAGAARELLAAEPVVAEAVARCDALLAAIEPAAGPAALRSLLLAAETGRGAEVFAHEAHFALALGLAALWRSWGIEPAAVLGDGVGEIAAAVAAGALDVAPAFALVTARARALRRPLAAGVAAGAAAEGRVTDRIGATAPAALAAAAGDELAAAARRLPVRVPEVRLVCGRTGRQLDAAAIADPERWRLPASGWPALPAAGLQGLRDLGCTAFVEIGPGWTEEAPGPAPDPAAQPVAEAAPGTASRPARTAEPAAAEELWLAFSRPGAGLGAALAAALGQLYVRGAAVDWEALHAGSPRRFLGGLPTYPFRRQRFWLEGTPIVPPPPARRDGQPLLGRRLDLALGEAVFAAELGPASPPLLAEHRVYGLPVVSGSAWLAMALAAAGEMTGAWPLELRDVVFAEPCILAERRLRPVQLVWSPDGGAAGRFRIASQPAAGGGWRDHATGRAGSCLPAGVTAAHHGNGQPAAGGGEAMTGESFYRLLDEAGIALGAGFRWLQRIWQRSGEAGALLRASGDGEAEPYPAHPGLLDSCFLVLGAASLRPGERPGAAYLPLGIERLALLRRPQGELRCRARLREGGAATGVSVGDLVVEDAAGQPVLEVAGLVFKQAGRDALERAGRAVAAPPPRLYAVEWRPRRLPARLAAPATDGPAHGLAGRWLVVAGGPAPEPIARPRVTPGSRSVGEALARLLRQRGAACTLVAVGAGWSGGLAAAGRRLAAAGAPLAGVVDLRGIDATAGAGQLACCGGALELIQDLAATGGALPRLWLVTRGAQAAGAAPPEPWAATLWGLGDVARQEHPGLRCCCVDLDAAAPDGRAAAALLAELTASEPRLEGRVALRGGERRVARLVRTAWPLAGAAPPVRPDAAYLVSGGLGALGLEVAEWLVRHGARELALLGRSAPRPAVERRLAALEAVGARVRVLRADVARRGELAAALAALAPGPPLAGVVHAAGVLDDGVIANQTWERFARVLAPKVEGAWNLHQLLAGRPLDFFVLFSSAASLTGAAGQSGYAAANAFLDALAHHRRAAGLPALALNWGPWGGAGMAAALDDRAARRLAVRGVGALAPAAALALLGRLLADPGTPPQVAVLAVDWSRYLAALPAGETPPLLEAIGEEAAVAAGATGAAAAAATGPTWSQRLRAAAPTERPRMLLAYVRQRAAGVLGLGDGAALDPAAPLGPLGLDSLMAVELKGRIEGELAVALSTAFLLKGPSPAELADGLLAALAVRSLAVADGEGAAAPGPAAEWEVLRL